MGVLQVMLSALKYPRSNDFKVTDEADCKQLLFWLENTKIRQYKVEDRTVLRDVNNPAWKETLLKYLGDADCPMKYEKSSMEEIFQWLLGYAVSLEYNDKAEELNKKAEELEPPVVEDSKTLPPFDDLGSNEVQQQLAKLLRLLKLPKTSEPLPQQLEAALRVLDDQVLPLASLTLSTEPANGSPEPAAVLASLPLGFSTGDDQVDLAATVLRLLHVKQLRQLQTQIDHAIVAVQEFTANPKTDASLGKVGQ